MYAIFPGLTYQWLKDVDINGTIANVMTKINVESNFVRPDLKPYTFVSYSGALYFTEVQFTDGGMFYCVVTLAASAGSRLSTLQPPMRASTGVELRILGTRKYSLLLQVRCSLGLMRSMTSLT